MTRTTRARTSKADETVRKIINVSLKRIIQYGESGLSMTDISRDLGISRPTIYRYFPSREALLEGVFEYILDDYMSKLQAQINLRPEPKLRIDVIVDFAVARLKDGGAQLFQLEPKLVMGLMKQSQERLVAQCVQLFDPLFDMGEALGDKKIDRIAAARSFVLFSSAMAFFNTDTTTDNAGDMLRQVIRGLVQ